MLRGVGLYKLYPNLEIEIHVVASSLHSQASHKIIAEPNLRVRLPVGNALGVQISANPVNTSITQIQRILFQDLAVHLDWNLL